MRHGERRDRPDQPARAADQQQQGEDEEQVIDADEDVLDTEHQVAGAQLQQAGRGAHLERRLRRRQARTLLRTVEAADAHQHIRRDLGEAGDADVLAGQTARTVDLPTLHQAVVAEHHPRVAGRALLGQLHAQRQTAVAERRQLPQHAVALAGDLLQLQIAKAQFVRGAQRRPAGGERPDQPQHSQPGPAHGCMSAANTT
ncbi:hypothetical protein D3C80_1543610 [compost metagenome]